MKIIFLDFDGVIRIPVPTGGAELDAEFSSERMKRVAHLAEGAFAKIVISSDWRFRYDREGMADLLEPSISRELLHADWAAPVLAFADSDSASETRIPRGAEILCWLARNPEVEQFAILDDMHSRYFPLMKHRLVTCQLLDGFTEDRLARAHEVIANQG